MKINEIKNAHYYNITNFRHYLDSIYKRDLIISISAEDNNIKLWNINNYECILNLTDVNKKGELYSACFLYYNHDIYITTSNYHWYGKCESIKVFDLNGNIIKEINDSFYDTCCIDIFYDYDNNKKNNNNTVLSKAYIVTGNDNFVKSYDFAKNTVYHKYYDKNNKSNTNIHTSIIFNHSFLIESCFDGNIRIWNFHSAELLNKINIGKGNLYGVCLWNDDFLFIGCEDNRIKLLDLKTHKIFNNFIDNNNSVLCIKKY
jgi:hypothetical protein